MFLTNEQAQRFQAHLQSAGVRGDCATCGKAIDWVQMAELLAVPTYIHYEKGTSPLRAVRCVCPHCAVVTMFDATAIDL